RRASASRGELVYVDEATGASWTLSDVSLKIGGFRQSGPFDVAASARVRGKAGARDVDAAVSFSGRADLAGGDRSRLSADVSSLRVDSEGLTLAVSGKASSLTAPRAAFDAVLSASGKDLLKASGTVSSGARTDFDVNAETPGLDTRLLAKYLPGAKIPAADLPAAKAALSGVWAGERAELKSFRVAWAGGQVSGSATATGLGGSRPAYAGAASFGVDVPAIAPGEYPFLNLPPKLAVPAMRVDGEAALRNDALTLKWLKASLKQGAVTLAGSVRGLGGAKPRADLSAGLALSLPAFRAADLPVALPDVPPGLSVPPLRVDGTVRLTGDDVRLQKVTATAKQGSVTLDGTIAGALSGNPVPDVAVAGDVSLPALTDRDLPFPGVPAGLSVPASRWTAALSYSPRAVRVKSLRVKTGGNDVEISGTVLDPAGRRAYDLLVKCRSFALDELTRLTPRTRDMKLAGSGFFALSVTGTGEKPVYAGKLRFRGVGATVAGLPLADFTGTVSADGSRIDAPDVTGKVGDGTLKADLTLKDYASRFPEVQLDASLDRLDLGRVLAAKAALAKEAAGEPSGAGAPPPRAAGKRPEPMLVAASGRLRVGEIVHPSADVKDVAVDWSLHGIGGDMRDLDGDAQLQVGGGRIRALGDAAAQSKLVKVLIFPLLIVQKLGRLGGLRLFPNFNDIALHQIVGDYLFKEGVMTLRRSVMESSAARVSATGTIDLPAEALNLVVTAQVANVAPVDVAVTGSFDKPKTRVELGKLLMRGLLGR
ncbi:MAG: hypothetical protein KGM24_05470, partial [Elusimicrobia bacterium]|nr:hypothetical protein [Elusimicrobiota bacterium]